MTELSQKDAWNEFYRTQPRPWKGAVRNVTGFPFAKGDKVLDIGCGNGKTSSALAEEGYSVIGIDISDVAIETCKKIYGSKMRFVCASADSIPLDDDEVDGIAMVHVLEHLTDDEILNTLKEVRRVIRTGGKIFVRVFHYDDMRSGKGKMTEDGAVVRGNGIRYRYFDEMRLKNVFSGFSEISAERIDEVTKFKEIRSRIEAVYEKPA